MKLDVMFEAMVGAGASDLHVSSDHQPMIRVDGDVQPLAGTSVLTAAEVRELVVEIMSDRKREEFESCWDVDFGYELDGLGRFRCNVFMDHRGPGAVFRLIPSRILTADDLNLPDAVRQLCYLSKGLVVVTGPTGSGKSTTLAAMIDLINRTRSEHLITVEDPIEFVHASKKCLVNQREIHAHTKGFAAALRAALREDPDIVLVGEMRDLETMEIALETAETGHLVFGTLHTSTAASTVDRIIDKFPANQQNQIRTMLAESLKAVIAQTLCKRIPKGRVAALEVLIVTPAISANIRDGKTFHIPSAMQIGKRLGMQMLNDELLKLVQAGTVHPKEAFTKAVDKEDMAKKYEQAGLSRYAGVDVAAELAGAEGRPNPEETVADLRRALVSNPADQKALNNLAWILATHEDEAIRDGEEAVRLATQAYKLNSRDASVLDTLAAAHAETGAYRKAVGFARRAIELAAAAGDEEMAKDLTVRLDAYRSGSSFRTNS